MRRNRFGVAALVLATGLLCARTAGAQGFGIYEYSACQMAMGGAGVASPCDDGSAGFYNPAALAMQGRVLGVVGAIISPRGGFTQDVTGLTSDMKDRNIPVPAIYFNMPIGKSMAFGLSFNAPYGLSTEWPENSLGRFLGYKSKVEGIFIQPTFAWQTGGKFAIGGGLDFTLTRLELKQHADLYYVSVSGTPYTFGQLGVPKGTDFADLQLKGDSMQVGYHLGVLIKPTPAFAFGARYLGKQKSEIDSGTIDTTQISTGLRLPIQLGPYPAGTPIDALVAPQFQSGGRLSDQDAVTAVTLPDQFVIGVAIQPSEAFKFMFDYQWVHWQVFDVLEVVGSAGLTETVYEKYGNTNGFRLGAQYSASKAFDLRFGFVAHNAAAPDVTVTPNLPEADRKLYTVGFGAKLGGGFVFDFAYNYLQQDDRRGRTTSCGVEQPTLACNDGLYQFHANLLGLGLSWHF
jgi:long-chain fatty acid transport protein